LFAPHAYIFVLRAHPVRGESHNQRNTTGEVATLHKITSWIQKAESYSEKTQAKLKEVHDIIALGAKLKEVHETKPEEVEGSSWLSQAFLADNRINKDFSPTSQAFASLPSRQ